MSFRIVLDTNVLVAALRSRRGASFRLLGLIGTGRFDIVVSVPLVLEYEEAMLRAAADVGFDREAVGDILDYVCAVADRREIFFLWRPFLKDPGDDLVLEVGVAGECDAIVTFNERDFKGAEDFGLQVVRPAKFLQMIGEVP
jgi:putative PIN family toxin of toxin-antitoxin system